MLSSLEAVGLSLSRCNRTFSNAIHAVHLSGVELSKSMLEGADTKSTFVSR
jgi:hypothetical protein